MADNEAQRLAATSARAIARRPRKAPPLVTGDLTPRDLIDQGGDFKTNAKFRRTMENTPYPTAVLDIIPKPRGRGSANRVEPWNDVEGVERRVANQERAYFSAKSTQMPFTWLIKQDEADLPYLEDPEIMHLLLTEQYQNEEFVRSQQKWNEQISRRTDEIMEGREKNQTFWNNVENSFIFGLAGSLGLPEALGFTTPQITTAEARAQAENELLGQVAPAKESFFSQEIVSGLSLDGLFGLLQKTITVAGTAGMITTSYALKGLSQGRVDPLAYMEKLWQENTSDQRAEYLEVLSAPEQTQVQRAREAYGEAWFDQVLAEGGAETFITMGLGDPATARALMEQAANFMFDESPELQNQVMTALEDESLDLIQELDNSAFEVSGNAAALIGWYGHNVPNRLATYFTVFFSQEDITDFFTSDGYLKIHEEAVAADFQPSKVLGIDGTTQGVFFDLGMGGMFDPLNLVLGPAGRALGINTVAQASRVARAPATRAVLRDVAKTVRSYFRGDDATAALLEGFDEFGMFDEVYAAAAGVDKVFSNRAWLNHPAARVTRELPVEAILSKLPDDVVAEGRRIAATVRALGPLDEAALLLDTPAAVQYSRLTGGLTMSADDVARLLLSQEFAGTNSVAFPMYGKVIDNIPDEVVQVLDDAAANPGDYVYHVSKGPIEGDWTGGGISQRPMSRTDAAAASGERLIFRRSDVAAVLDERALKYFENGGDIEQLLPQGSYVSRRANRPVATGPMPQPVARVSVEDFARHQKPPSTRVPDSRVHRLPDDNDFSLNSLLDEDVLYPELKEIMPRMEALTERLYARGGGMSLPVKTATSRVAANTIRAAFKSHNSIGPWALRFWNRLNVGTFLRTHGFGWEQDIRQTIFRMFGHDEPTSNLWLGRFREALRFGDDADLTSLRLQLRNATDELKALDDSAGGIIGDDAALGVVDDLQPGTVADESVVVDEIDDVTRRIESEASAFEADRFGAAVLKRRNELRAEVAKLQADETRRLMALQKARGAAAQRVITEMWEDFNRRYIATNPQWAKHVGRDGLVPWEVITGGTRRTSTRSGLRISSKEANALEGNQFIDELMDDLGAPGVQLPLAPLDMIAASELNGAKWLQYKQIRWVEEVKNVGNLLDRLWKMDKVFRLSTAMTVSFDELLRVFHRYGAPAVMQYIEDKIMFRAANVKTAFGRNNAPTAGFIDKLDTSAAIFKNKRWAERMRRLNEYPEFYKQVERQYYEMFEDSWDDIAFGDAEWLPAMDKWTSNLLQQDGFRAYLRGRPEFSKWWNSEEGAYLRTRNTLDFGDGKMRLATEDEAYKGFETLMNRFFLGKVRSGRLGDVRQAWVEAANRIAAGEQGVTLAESILREMPVSVRGVKNLAPSASYAGRMSNQFFDTLFMQPTNYRRGFIAEIARKYETRRLMELYNSQGLQIIPDWKINSILPEYNVRNTAAFGLPEAIEQMLFDKGIVPQSTIARMAERKAMAEIEHIMYTWHQSSRIGRSPALRAAFPFGKPYYDMWAHYGREMLSRPALRGYLNNTNFGNLANKALDRFPVNPRPASLVSRIAATDFDAEKSGVDFSPLLFLPSEGEDIANAIFPGFGMLPMWAGDVLLTMIKDPFEEPGEYQALVDAMSEWVPPLGYGQSGFVGRLFGGGALATSLKFIADGIMMGSGRTFHQPLSLFGDIQASIRTNRGVKAILGDPEEWDMLLSAQNTQQFEVMVEAIIDDAFRRGAGGHAGELAARWAVPANLDFDTTDDDVQDVWLTAAEKFPQIAPRFFNRNAEDDVLKEHADDIRNAFFDLPREERDKLIVQYPQIAVNMVGGWEWTTDAQNDFPNDANTPYRVMAGAEGLARHQSYIRNNYIQPIAAPALMARILGTVFQARLNLTKSLYNDAATQINEYMWENVVPERGRAFFEALVTEGTVDASSGREVWQNFSQYKDKIEEVYGPTSLPSSMEAWGTSWRGLEEDGFSQRFREITLGEEWSEITPAMQEKAAILGIELEAGMTGEQFVGQLHDLIRNNVAGEYGVAPSSINDEFSSYRDARSAESNAAFSVLRQLVAGENGDPEFKAAMNDFLDYEARTNSLRNEQGMIDPERAREVVKQYTQLMNSNPELAFNWQEKWRDGFESDYGPLDWKPPVPPTLNIDDHRNTYRPYIWDVQDGDTLVVSTEPSAPWLDLPGTRFDVLSGGTPQKHSVRLLGIYAPELSTGEPGKEWMDRLTDAIMEAKRNGTPIYLVRDKETTGNRNVDFFGRELAWLFIGDQPYYFPETISPGT